MPDNAPPVPEIFVEGYRGAFARAGLVKLNLVSNRLPIDAEAPILDHVATLTIPLADLIEIVGALNSLVEELRNKAEAAATEGPRT